MNIAILGTRGIPNNYGGFEQFAEYLSVGLAQRGHSVTVYNPHNHPFKKSAYQGVRIKKVFDPEYKLGTAGQFIYDFLSVLDTRKHSFDIIFQLGYTSSSLFFKLHSKKALVVTNMDGLEWKRTKYRKHVKSFLRFAEKLAVQNSGFLISDSYGIQEYLQSTYQVDSTYIPYGASCFDTPNENVLLDYQLKPYKYHMLVARLEPENNIETILTGAMYSRKKIPLLIIGNHDTKYGHYLKQTFPAKHFQFLGGIYDIDVLNNLRYYSQLYFHGHSVGGTNPSLLEAMASRAFICAHNNIFNKSILQNDAFYFDSVEDVTKAIDNLSKTNNLEKIKSNMLKIREIYSWKKIIDQHEALFIDILQKQRVGLLNRLKVNF